MRAPLLALLLVVAAASDAPIAQSRPSQADAVVRLIADLQNALASGQSDHFRTLAATSLPAGDGDVFLRAAGAARPASAAVRERARRPAGPGGVEALVEVLVTHGRAGRLATWQVSARARSGEADRYELTGLKELTAVDGLLRLALDTDRQFVVHDLVYHAPDFTLRMASGTAFVAASETGTHGVVLLGDGHVHFAPPDEAEQGQLKVFDGRPQLDATLDAAFIRVNPAELDAHFEDRSFAPAPSVDRAALTRATRIFDDMAPHTYNLDLGDLSDDRWSLEAAPGSTVVEFKTGKFGWLTYARSPADPEDISLYDRARVHNISIYASAESLAAHGRAWDDDAGRAFDIEQIELDLSFDPERSWIAGRGSLRIKLLQDHLTSLTFRLAQPLTVSSVASPTFGRLLALRVIGRQSIVVSLPAGGAKNSEVVLDIDYSGRLEPQGSNQELLRVEPSRQVPQEEIPIQPEPRFLYSSRVPWYPQGPAFDFATATMRLTVPSQYQIVASGTLTQSSVLLTADPRYPAGDRRSVRTSDYRIDRPVPYLACLISRFVPAGTVRIDAADLNLEVVSTPRQAGQNRKLPPQVADMIKLYAAKLGDAPYGSLTLAAVDDNLPGGHSPPYFAIWQRPLPTTPYNWQNDPLAFDSYPPFYLAHEIAHQWWGLAVSWKSYHDQWMSEALAHYFALEYAAADRGRETMQALLAQMRQSALTFSSQGPIALGYRLGHIRNDSRPFRAVLYNKSAVVLHMLRRLIGDAAFDAGMKRFYHTWKYQKAGTDDLRAAFEAESAMSLERFFQQWIVGSALPRVRISSHVDPDGASALVRIEQIGGVFDFPLTVTVQYADGHSDSVSVAVTEATVERRIPLTGTVRRITAKDDLTLAIIVD